MEFFVANITESDLGILDTEHVLGNSKLDDVPDVRKFNSKAELVSAIPENKRSKSHPGQLAESAWTFFNAPV